MTIPVAQADNLKTYRIVGSVTSPEARFEELAVRDFSARIEYANGVLKLTDLQPAQYKPLAEVKTQIVDEIRKQIAASRFSDMATKLTSLVYDQRDSLEPAADALGLKIRQAGGITRTGLLPSSSSWT